MASRKPAVARARSVASLTALRAQLRIELREVRPLVWRRLLVPETVTLAKLHGILQWTMGWMNSHLHEFEIARQRYGVPDTEWEPPGAVTDERRVRLKPLLEAGVRRFTYVYDFGDHWEHLIKVEDLVPPCDGLQPIVCLAGENACPPEDVGGVPGYAEFLAALADPKHEEHASLREWIGYPFNPTAFDVVAVNKILATIKP